MFRSSFSKYLTAFVVIIFVSFLLLSGIITSMVRSHITEDKKEKLELASSAIAKYFENEKLDPATALTSNTLESVVTLLPLINVDYKFNIVITDLNGSVILTTTDYYVDGAVLPIKNFITKTDEERGEALTFRGDIPGVTNESSLLYGDDVRIDSDQVAYVFAVASTASEDKLIEVTRKAVINSSIWVMLAAVIAAYFITDRIVNPLKNMTGAVKRFAKGDFSERVNVSGNDEVSELGLAFNNMAESLESLEKMRNSFLASVSHDLRTPMTTIAGFIDGINSGAIPPEQHSHYLGVISAEVHRLSRLVGQLLDLSRIESGDRKFNFTDFDIAEVARLIIISFEHRIDEKHLEVEFMCDEDSVFANADKDAIYQVLYNLVHNAIKFAKDGGRFAIEINRIQGKKIRVSVYDEGQTIAKEDTQHIFDRFYKTDKSRGLDKNGVGLGLYISKTIIDAHKETIRVEPRDDGCEFWFTVSEGDNPKGKI